MAQELTLDYLNKKMAQDLKELEDDPGVVEVCDAVEDIDFGLPYDDVNRGECLNCLCVTSEYGAIYCTNCENNLWV